MNTATINRQAIEAWIADLRAAGNAQVHGNLTVLVDGVRLDCCLGRACKLAAEEGIVVAVERPTYGYEDEDLPSPLDGHTVVDIGYHAPGEHPSMAEYGVLPQAVAEWMGITEEDPMLITDDSHIVDVQALDTRRRRGMSLSLDEPTLGFAGYGVSAAGLNDRAFWDFNKIADAIEAKYLDGE